MKTTSIGFIGLGNVGKKLADNLINKKNKIFLYDKNPKTYFYFKNKNVFLCKTLRELVFNSKFGSGNTVFQAANRNMLKNFALQQHKLEYRSPRLTARIYTSIEDSGNTHDMSALGGRIANAQPGGILGWYGNYLNAYFNELPTLVNPNPITALNTMVGAIVNNGITDTMVKK